MGTSRPNQLRRLISRFKLFAAKSSIGRDLLQKRARKNIGKNVGAGEPGKTFLEWVRDAQLEKHGFWRRARILECRYRLRWFGSLFVFCFLLSSFLLADFDFTYSVRVGEQAARDIKSPINFEIVDEFATDEKRRFAEANVPAVFDYDRTAFDSVYSRIYQGFRRMREIAHQVNWSSDELDRDLQAREFLLKKPEFEAILGRSLGDLEFEWLTENHFSLRVENILIEILDSWTQLRLAQGLDRGFSQPENVVLREVVRGAIGREELVDSRELHDLSRSEDFPSLRTQGPERLTAHEQKMLSQIARSLLGPNVTLNRQETQLRKQKARDAIPAVSITVKRNQVIVPEGDTVLPYHVRLLAEIEARRSLRNRNLMVLASALLFMALILVCMSFLRRFTLNRVRASTADLLMMATVCFVVVLISKFFLFLLGASVLAKFSGVIPEQALVFATPSAAGAMLVGLLIPSGEIVWIFTLFMGVVLGSLADLKFTYSIVTIVGGIAAARGVQGCKTRNDIYWAGVRTGMVSAVMSGLIITVTHYSEPGYARLLAWTAPAGFVSGIFSSLVAMTLIPLLESLFGATTDVKLLELSNLNHPLLKEMVVQAPGTYHHSLVVGSMVEAAAEEIGANPLLAKVMSYYHDIGKTEHAGYFIENQRPGQNPHDHLSPNMSKTVLVAHVKDGIELGLRYKLGTPILDGIEQHHGTTLIAFFYNRAMESQDESIDAVQEEDFRYPGPKPQFREAALIMLADSIEAASRSLDEPTPVRLQNIVKNIIQRKFMDGQLDECNLNLRDLTVVEASFIRVLLGIYHQRIDYPRKAGGGASEAPAMVAVKSAKSLKPVKGPTQRGSA